MSFEAVDIAKIVTKAGIMIANKDNWCKGVQARDSKGIEVAPTSRRAVQWDAIGAICAAVGCDFSKKEPHNINEAAASLAAAHSISNRLHKMSLERVNDDLGHEAVLAVLRQTVRSNRSMRVSA